MAVYTEVSDGDVEQLLNAYDIGRPVSLKGIAEGVENTNYLLLTDQNPYILTLYEKRVAERDLPFFLSLTEHLAQHGVTCPLPVRRRDGEVISTVQGRPAAIITFLIGKWPRKIEVWHLDALGAAVGRMHRAVSDFSGQRENALSVEGWRVLYQKIADDLDAIEPGLKQAIGEELEYLKTHWPKRGALPEGIIHADLFPDNVFFDKGALTGLIDFYFACFDFLAYDLAVCLNAWCFDVNGTFYADKARAMFASYQVERALLPEEKEAFSLLARGAALRFFLTRAHDWIHHDEAALVTPKDPMEYMRKLTFHQQVVGTDVYGFNA